MSKKKEPVVLAPEDAEAELWSQIEDAHADIRAKQDALDEANAVLNDLSDQLATVQNELRAGQTDPVPVEVEEDVEEDPEE